jgi:archaellum component FlaC
LLVGTLCSVGCVSKTKHELALAEAEQLNRNVAALQQDLATSQSQREALDTKLQAVQADLENTNKSLQERNQELNEVNEAIARRNKQVQDLIDKIAIVEADLNQKQTALEDAVARVAAAEALAKRTHDLYDDLVADLSNELAANDVLVAGPRAHGIPHGRRMLLERQPLCRDARRPVVHVRSLSVPRMLSRSAPRANTPSRRIATGCNRWATPALGVSTPTPTTDG